MSVCMHNCKVYIFQPRCILQIFLTGFELKHVFIANITYSNSF